MEVDTIHELMTETTPRIPADAFETTILRSYIERELGKWNQELARADVSHEAENGWFRLSITDPTRKFNALTFLSEPTVWGKVGIFDLNGRPYVVWVLDQDQAGVYGTSNTGADMPVINWSKVK